MKPERRGSAWPSAPVPGRVFAIDVAEGLNCGTRSEEEPAVAKRKAAPKEDAAQDDAPSTVPKDSVYIGKSIKPEFIYLRLANRHGLNTGATGTGKTVTLQGLRWRTGNRPTRSCKSARRRTLRLRPNRAATIRGRREKRLEGPRAATASGRPSARRSSGPWFPAATRMLEQSLKNSVKR